MWRPGTRALSVDITFRIPRRGFSLKKDIIRTLSPARSAGRETFMALLFLFFVLALNGRVLENQVLGTGVVIAVCLSGRCEILLPLARIGRRRVLFFPSQLGYF